MVAFEAFQRELEERDSALAADRNPVGPIDRLVERKARSVLEATDDPIGHLVEVDSKLAELKHPGRTLVSDTRCCQDHTTLKIVGPSR